MTFGNEMIGLPYFFRRDYMCFSEPMNVFICFAFGNRHLNLYFFLPDFSLMAQFVFKA